MDRAILQQHLNKAEEHVRLGALHVEQQRGILAELEREGLNTALARKLFKSFEEAQEMHVADRNRIAAELAQVN